MFKNVFITLQVFILISTTSAVFGSSESSHSTDRYGFASEKHKVPSLSGTAQKTTQILIFVSSKGPSFPEKYFKKKTFNTFLAAQGVTCYGPCSQGCVKVNPDTHWAVCTNRGSIDFRALLRQKWGGGR